LIATIAVIAFLIAALISFATAIAFQFYFSQIVQATWQPHFAILLYSEVASTYPSSFACCI
jgi:hypothetical protein